MHFVVVITIVTRQCVCDQEQWNTMSPLFNDVHVMVFLGIAFILTFLRSYRCGQITWDSHNVRKELLNQILGTETDKLAIQCVPI